LFLKINVSGSPLSVSSMAFAGLLPRSAYRAFGPKWRPFGRFLARTVSVQISRPSNRWDRHDDSHLKTYSCFICRLLQASRLCAPRHMKALLAETHRPEWNDGRCISDQTDKGTITARSRARITPRGQADARRPQCSVSSGSNLAINA